MNIIRKLTLRHLQANKARTIVTVLGIGVSAAMITAVFVGMVSLMNMFGEIELGLDGNCQAVFSGITDEQYDELCKDSAISTVGCYSMEPDMSFCLEDRPSDRAGVGDVYQADEMHLKQMITCSYEGNLPKNGGELAVEEELLSKNHLDWKVGDTVTVPMGTRYVEEKGERMPVKGRYVGGEEFEGAKEQRFLITAILHDNQPTENKGDLLIGMEDEERGEYFGAAITLKEINHQSYQVIMDMIKKYNLEEAPKGCPYAYEYSVATTYLASHFATSKDNQVIQSIIPLTLTMLILIMIASILLIYNAFNMSLSERVRYLGMLASVGATRKQKRASIYFEGFLLGAVGLPIGILAGIAGISVVLRIIFRKMLESSVIREYNGIENALQTVVPFWCIAAILFVGAVTICLSAMIPAKRASQITPIDAIRQNTELRIKGRQLRTPWYIRLLFGYEGELAHKSLRRNKGKTRTITMSLMVSVVLFLTVNYFCKLFVVSNNIGQDVPYQVQVMATYEQRDALLDELSKMDNIEGYFGINKWYQIYGKKANPGIKKSELMEKENLTKKYQKFFDSSAVLYINWIEDKEFNELVESSGGNAEEYYGDALKALVMNNVSHEKGNNEIFTEELLGKQINIDTEIATTIELHDFIAYDKDNYICNLNSKNSISLYIPESVAHRFEQEQYKTSDDITSFMCGVQTKEHEAVAEDLQMLIEEKDFKHAMAMDYTESGKAMNAIIFIMQLIINGFLALITLITLANIINTICTGMALRKKEFAMLKSVGTTPAGFSRMIRLESVFYGIKALVIGLPLSVCLSYLLYRANNIPGLPFEIPVVLYLIVIGTVFLIVGLSMWYSLHRTKGDSIVETLKQEIS